MKTSKRKRTATDAISNSKKSQEAVVKVEPKKSKTKPVCKVEERTDESTISIKTEDIIDDDKKEDEDVDGSSTVVTPITEPKSVKVSEEGFDLEPVKEEKRDIKTAPALANKARKNVKSEGKFVGAHVSIAGGLENAILSAEAIGGRAIGMFLTGSRQWKSKPLEDAAIERFKQACEDFQFPIEMILPHGSYLMNCGSPKQETLQKSRDVLVDELQRCDRLGIPLYNFHPGSTCGEITREACIDLIAESINLAHGQTKYVITVIENMCCQGNTIGGKFSELAAIIDRITDKSRVGVCLDTCHAFAAGYDLTTDEGFEAMMTEFDQVVGFGYLKALHINDSVGKLGCHKDRHEDIGKGCIGMDGFRRVMNEPRFDNIPMVLETKGITSYAKQIKILYSLCK